MSKPVLVGYDGSATSQLAVAWAVTAAAQRSAPLTIVTTWAVPGLPYGMGMGTAPSPSLEDQAEQEARLLLDPAVARARELDATATVPITGLIIDEAPAKALIELSQDAALVVVGTHGRHGLVEALLGSVSRQVMTHAKCPVVVVRQPADPEASEVVVGVDGSPSSRAALEFAFEHANHAGLRLRVLSAWEMPAVHAAFPADQVAHDFRSAAERGTAEMVEGLAERWPDVVVEQDIVGGIAAELLIEASERAALVVVGSRGHGGFVGLLLGSVSTVVGHYAECPVAIVH